MTLILAYQGEGGAVVGTDLLHSINNYPGADRLMELKPILKFFNEDGSGKYYGEKFVRSFGNGHYIAASGRLNLVIKIMLHTTALNDLINSKEPPNRYNVSDLKDNMNFDFAVLDPNQPQLYFRMFSQGHPMIRVPENTFFSFGVINYWKREDSFKEMSLEEIADTFQDTITQLKFFRSVDGYATYIIRKGEVARHSISI